MIRLAAHHPYEMAHGLASLGRNGDSTLVHMSPDEIGGLQSLAQAHGKSLTTNPQTGLPEAFSLKGFLPMLAGLVLSPFTGGMSMGAAMALEAGAGAATGALTGQKGWGLLGSALGGVGGAGLGSALMGAGEAGAAGAAGAAGTAGTALPEVAAPDMAAAGAAAGLPEVPLTALPQGASSVGTALSSGTGLVGGAGTASASGLASPSLAAEIANSSPSLGNVWTSGMSNMGKGLLNPSGVYSGLGGLSGTAKTAAMLAAPVVSQMANNQNDGITDPVKGTQYYNVSYNRGQVNPLFGTPGQPYYIGGGYTSTNAPGSTSPWSTTYGGSKTPQTSGYVYQGVGPQNLAHGGSVSHYDAGGPTVAPPVPTPAAPATPMSDTMAGLNKYYQGQAGLGALQSLGQEMGSMPPPPTAMENYMSNVNGRAEGSIPALTPAQLESAKAAQANLPPPQATSFPSSFTDSTKTTYNYNNYSYDPRTGQFTTVNGPGAGRYGGFQGFISPFNTYNNPSSPPPSSDPSMSANHPNYYGGGSYGKAEGGGIAALHGTYAAGGKLLRGDGDGMSDSIPAVIHGGDEPQKAALADGEFVIPADVVSHLGNGSTEAGSKTLYKMMDKVRMARTGNSNQGKQINPNKYMPA